MPNFPHVKARLTYWLVLAIIGLEVALALGWRPWWVRLDSKTT